MKQQHLTDRDLKRELSILGERFHRLSEDDLFILWFLRARVTEGEDSAAKALVGVSGEKAVDAVFIDEPARVVVVVQGKYRRGIGRVNEKRGDVLAFAELAERLWEDKRTYRDFERELDPSVRDALRVARERLHARGFSLHLIYLTTGRVSETEQRDASSIVRRVRGPSQFEVLDSVQLRNAGYPGMADFLGKGEAVWSSRQGQGGKRGFESLVKQLNTRQKLTKHPADESYLVVIPTSARIVLSCVVQGGKRLHRESGLEVFTSGIILTNTNSFVRANSGEEAHYLCALLNSGPVNQLVKQSTQKGTDTERHTHREPLQLPIPRFDPKSAEHRQLASLSVSCTTRVEELLSGELVDLVKTAYITQRLADLRSTIKARLSDVQLEIDSTVGEILGLPAVHRRLESRRLRG